ncbi:protein ELYS isoform X6 [Cimex lectularius]|uniref:Protein ELYS n=1 Tax=Cimex lectularius TaxID=79782 RepID=A0A8I6SHI8_CIMLE|nr:protein ELYS isoform X6 [Cimex lectularius]
MFRKSPVITTSIPFDLAVKRKMETSGETTKHDIISSLLLDEDYVWVASGSTIYIMEKDTGSYVSYHTFGDEDNPALHQYITCVEQYSVPDFDLPFMIIGTNSIKEGFVSVYNPLSSMIRRTVNIGRQVSCVSIIDDGVSEVSPFPGLLSEVMLGILAVGCVDGSLILMDLRRDLFLKGESQPFPPECEIADLHYIDEPFNKMEVKNNFDLCIHSKNSLAVLMIEGKEEYQGVSALYFSKETSCLFIGFGTGSWEMRSMHDFRLLYSTAECEYPIYGFVQLEPCDDPKHMLYLWVTYQTVNGNIPFMSLYNLSFVTKEEDPNYGRYYKGFRSCTMSFEFFPDLIVKDAGNSKVVSCTSLPRKIANSHPRPYCKVDEPHTLAFTGLWVEKSNASCSYLIVFDLDQWYKSQMPTSSIAVSPYLDVVTITDKHVDGVNIIRSSLKMENKGSFEVYFYPQSLDYEILCTCESEFIKVKKHSLQSIWTEKIKSTGVTSLVFPTKMCKEAVYAGLIPKFLDPINVTQCTEEQKRAFLLSILMELNLTYIISDAVNVWKEGHQISNGCSLEFIVDWMWNTVSSVWDKANSICSQLYNGSGTSIEFINVDYLYYSNKTINSFETLFSGLLEQLKLYLPKEDLDHKYNAMCVIQLYLRYVCIFSGENLLPEKNSDGLPESSIYYDYQGLKANYEKLKKETKIRCMDNLNKSGQPDHSLYLLDYVIGQHKPAIGTQWEQEGGTTSYPPPSIQSLLRTCLIQGVPQPVIHCIFHYFILDLIDLLQQKNCRDSVQKLKELEAKEFSNYKDYYIMKGLWMIDHLQFEDGLNCLIIQDSLMYTLPVETHRAILQTFLSNNQGNLAYKLVALDDGNKFTQLDDIKLEMSILISNGPPKDAYNFQNKFSEHKEKLFMQFLEGCLHSADLRNFLFKLNLDPEEERLCELFFNTNKTPLAVKFHLLYLIHHRRYFEADEIRKRHSEGKANLLGERIVKGLVSVLPPIAKQTKLCAHSAKQDILQHSAAQCLKPKPLSVFIKSSKHNVKSIKDLIIANMASTWRMKNVNTNQAVTSNVQPPSNMFKKKTKQEINEAEVEKEPVASQSTSYVNISKFSPMEIDLSSSHLPATSSINKRKVRRWEKAEVKRRKVTIPDSTEKTPDKQFGIPNKLFGTPLVKKQTHNSSNDHAVTPILKSGKTTPVAIAKPGNSFFQSDLGTPKKSIRFNVPEESPQDDTQTNDAKEEVSNEEQKLSFLEKVSRDVFKNEAGISETEELSDREEEVECEEVEEEVNNDNSPFESEAEAQFDEIEESRRLVKESADFSYSDDSSIEVIEIRDNSPEKSPMFGEDQEGSATRHFATIYDDDNSLKEESPMLGEDEDPARLGINIADEDFIQNSEEGLDMNLGDDAESNSKWFPKFNIQESKEDSNFSEDSPLVVEEIHGSSKEPLGSIYDDKTSIKGSPLLEEDEYSSMDIETMSFKTKYDSQSKEVSSVKTDETRGESLDVNIGSEDFIQNSREGFVADLEEEVDSNSKWSPKFNIEENKEESSSSEDSRMNEEEMHSSSKDADNANTVLLDGDFLLEKGPPANIVEEIEMSPGGSPDNIAEEIEVSPTGSPFKSIEEILNTEKESSFHFVKDTDSCQKNADMFAKDWDSSSKNSSSQSSERSLYTSTAEDSSNKTTPLQGSAEHSPIRFEEVSSSVEKDAQEHSEKSEIIPKEQPTGTKEQSFVQLPEVSSSPDSMSINYFLFDMCMPTLTALYKTPREPEEPQMPTERAVTSDIEEKDDHLPNLPVSENSETEITLKSKSSLSPKIYIWGPPIQSKDDFASECDEVMPGSPIQSTDDFTSNECDEVISGSTIQSTDDITSNKCDEVMPGSPIQYPDDFSSKECNEDLIESPAQHEASIYVERDMSFEEKNSSWPIESKDTLTSMEFSDTQPNIPADLPKECDTTVPQSIQVKETRLADENVPVNIPKTFESSESHETPPRSPKELSKPDQTAEESKLEVKLREECDASSSFVDEQPAEADGSSKMFSVEMEMEEEKDDAKSQMSSFTSMEMDSTLTIPGVHFKKVSEEVFLVSSLTSMEMDNSLVIPGVHFKKVSEEDAHSNVVEEDPKFTDQLTSVKEKEETQTEEKDIPADLPKECDTTVPQSIQVEETCLADEIDMPVNFPKPLESIESHDTPPRSPKELNKPDDTTKEEILEVKHREECDTSSLSSFTSMEMDSTLTIPGVHFKKVSEEVADDNDVATPVQRSKRRKYKKTPGKALKLSDESDSSYGLLDLGMLEETQITKGTEITENHPHKLKPTPGRVLRSTTLVDYSYSVLDTAMLNNEPSEVLETISAKRTAGSRKRRSSSLEPTNTKAGGYSKVRTVSESQDDKEEKHTRPRRRAASLEPEPVGEKVIKVPKTKVSSRKKSQNMPVLSLTPSTSEENAPTVSRAPSTSSTSKTSCFKKLNFTNLEAEPISPKKPTTGKKRASSVKSYFKSDSVPNEEGHISQRLRKRSSSFTTLSSLNKVKPKLSNLENIIEDEEEEDKEINKPSAEVKKKKIKVKQFTYNDWLKLEHSKTDMLKRVSMMFPDCTQEPKSPQKGPGKVLRSGKVVEGVSADLDNKMENKEIEAVVAEYSQHRRVTRNQVSALRRSLLMDSEDDMLIFTPPEKSKEDKQAKTLSKGEASQASSVNQPAEEVTEKKEKKKKKKAPRP